MSDPNRAVILNESTQFGGETGAGILRNRCAFTPRDMGADWPEAFTYAVVMGWDDAMDEMAARWDWDESLIEFLRDAHRQFQALADRRREPVSAPQSVVNVQGHETTPVSPPTAATAPAMPIPVEPTE